MPGRSPGPRARRGLAAALALGAALVALNNLAGWIGIRRWGDLDTAFSRLNPVLTASLLLTLAWRRPFRRDELGWRGCSTRDALLGALAGLLMGLPPALLFCWPVGLRRGPIQFALVSRLSPRAFAWKLLVDLPVVTVFWEELSFRGVLEAALRRQLSPRASALVSALFFAAGHVVLNHYSLKATNIQRTWLPHPLQLLGCLVSVGAGGLVFSGLRWLSGSLWPPALAHWLVDAVMIATFYLLGRRAEQP